MAKSEVNGRWVEDVQILGPDGNPVSSTNRLPVDAVFSGSTIEEVGGIDAMRTKQVALAYKGFDFADTGDVTITAGSSLQEPVSHEVNGFSTLSVIGTGVSPDFGNVLIEARWQSTPGSSRGGRSVREELGEIPNAAPFSLTFSGPTRSEHVFLILTNLSPDDDALVHVHGLLRV